MKFVQCKGWATAKADKASVGAARGEKESGIREWMERRMNPAVVGGMGERDAFVENKTGQKEEEGRRWMDGKKARANGRLGSHLLDWG